MKFTNLKTSEKRRFLTKIDELRKSDGWAILQQIIASEREDFFRKLSAPDSPLSVDIYHYSRGVIEGTYRLAELPDRVINELATGIKIDEINDPTNKIED